jgi:hypothetical protein
MIGSITEVGEAALYLGPTLEQMCWPRDDESYGQLREEADARLHQMGLEGTVLPPAQAEYLEAAGAVNRAVLEHLSAQRGRVNGDVVGLPLFLLTSLAFRSVIGMAFDTQDQQYVEQVQDCLEDLGVRRDLVHVLEREVGRIGLEAAGEDGEESASFSDLVLAGGGFVVRVLEEFGRSEPDFGRLEDMVATIDSKVTTLGSDIGDFRAESKERDTRVEQLVVEGNAEVITALDEVKRALMASGQVDAAQAEALTGGDPQGFWDRLQRWGAKTPARDAAEKALWAALDFVPAGSAVKLGFKVAEAIRLSLKASGALTPRPRAG